MMDFETHKSAYIAAGIIGVIVIAYALNGSKATTVIPTLTSNSFAGVDNTAASNAQLIANNEATAASNLKIQAAQDALALSQQNTAFNFLYGTLPERSPGLNSSSAYGSNRAAIQEYFTQYLPQLQATSIQQTQLQNQTNAQNQQQQNTNNNANQAQKKRQFLPR